jgi:FixJ family two-component response regulator
MDIISVVDDDESVRTATIDLLNSAGFDCEAFESAEAYLRSNRPAQTSCLILDIRMPGLNGLELQRRLFASGYSIRTIFITAFPKERTRAQAIGSGATCYLRKPYSDEELLACIRQALQSSQRDGEETNRK